MLFLRKKTTARAAIGWWWREARNERPQLPQGAEAVFDPSGGEASVLVVWSSLCFRLGYSERLAVSGFLFCSSQMLSFPPFSCSQLAHDTN